MRFLKYIVFFVLLFFSLSTFASSWIDFSCFKYNTFFSPSNNSTQKIKIFSFFNDIFFVQDGQMLAYKIFSFEKQKSIVFSVYNVSSWNKKDISFISDANRKTVYTFDELKDNQKNIILKFSHSLEAWKFESYFDFSHFWEVKYFISDDNIIYKQLQESDIKNFSFNYLKIEFLNKDWNKILSKTEIRDIEFLENNGYTYLVNPKNTSKIDIYGSYDCSDDMFQKELNTYINLNKKSHFSINSKTANFSLNFWNSFLYNKDFDKDFIENEKDNCKYSYNPKQEDSDKDLIWDICDYNNEFKNAFEKDNDNDGVWDSLDNCKYIYNPNQQDSNGDSFWDICMDDDNDGIEGRIDNCINIFNPDQKDINANNIGDACEFDKDKDEVFDSIDNCINILNPNQADKDEDGIGDICDNCKLYNPDQIDKNNNEIWDYCEEKEKFEKINDEDKDTIIDFTDNCKNIFNVSQDDRDKDWIGDACDNCLQIQNQDQEDSDNNGIGDLCEDSDKDTIVWYQDNCKSITNQDQKDSDNNGVGDVCEDSDNDGVLQFYDNCPFDMNIDQVDVDNDAIGDVCDTKDDRFIESNRVFFIGLLSFIALSFWWGIFMMWKRLKWWNKMN